MTDVALKCRCGSVRGVATNVQSGTRAVCYCRDCQCFAEYLDCADDVLDPHGGTDIFQLPPSRIEITEGRDKVRCMRIRSNGLFRWYTECCKTPIGNTISAPWPFVGLVHNFMEDAGSRDANLGPVRGHVNVKSARSSLPEEIRKSGDRPFMIVAALSKIVAWKLKGLGRPNPFFDASGAPISEPHILDTPKAKMTE